jgi:glycosyltransferase involved in cell wall biosynthesis
MDERTTGPLDDLEPIAESWLLDSQPDRLDAPCLLSIVVPVFNEVDVVAAFIPAIRAALRDCRGVRTEFIFVDDGSSDGTHRALQAIADRDSSVTVIELSRNFGKEAALTAGLDCCSGDAVVPMDVDLQDPPSLLPRMIEAWRAGHDVVLARRQSRAQDSVLKRLTAAAFYRLHNLVSGTQIEANVGDFRLMDRCVIDALRRLPESQRFMKGLFAWIGFRTTVLDYSRPPRSAGSSKFSTWQLWNLAIEGITSFSTAPLRVWTYLGFSVAAMSFLYGAFLVIRTFTHGVDVPGFASILCAVMFLGGVQLMGIGVLGEYLGRTYLEAKGRPTYVTRSILRAGQRQQQPRPTQQAGAAVAAPWINETREAQDRGAAPAPASAAPRFAPRRSF